MNHGEYSLPEKQQTITSLSELGCELGDGWAVIIEQLNNNKMKLAKLARELNNGLKAHTKLEQKIAELEISAAADNAALGLLQIHYKLCVERARLETEIERIRLEMEEIFNTDPHALEKTTRNNDVALLS